MACTVTHSGWPGACRRCRVTNVRSISLSLLLSLLRLELFCPVLMCRCHVFDEPNAYLVTVCSIDHPSSEWPSFTSCSIVCDPLCCVCVSTAPCVEGWRRIHAPPSGVLVSPLPSGGPSILTLVAQVDISAMFTTLPRAHSARHTVLGLSMPLSPELLLPKGAPSLERCKEYTEPSPTVRLPVCAAVVVVCDVVPMTVPLFTSRPAVHCQFQHHQTRAQCDTSTRQCRGYKWKRIARIHAENTLHLGNVTVRGCACVAAIVCNSCLYARRL